MNIYQPEFVKGHFNRMSRSYEVMNIFTSFGFSIWWRKQFLTTIPATDKKISVLDLLSGMGETWYFIRKRFSQCEISAIDFSEQMNKYAKNKNEQLFDTTVYIVEEDVLNNTLRENSFDIITSSFGLKTFDDIQLNTLGKEVSRLLKHGGKFSFIEVSIPDSKILFFFYRLYIKYFISFVGGLFFDNNEEYRMLWEYTVRFINAKKIVPIFENYGLKVQYKSYFFGCASGVIGYKV